jgi:hypothetical protein
VNGVEGAEASIASDSPEAEHQRRETLGNTRKGRLWTSGRVANGGLIAIRLTIAAMATISRGTGRLMIGTLKTDRQFDMDHWWINSASTPVTNDH